ncbi:hypothetical protein C8F04DRAFT_1191603 [Mycena alexandri]|uniref:F-box domain-containing protein n=1 Tax=Mycena alexandri TaxID=1745969 RepID=A0AAD6SCD3_9AGAR|nr:hypothetical protein C8F04DRAFT_1191603 [Mycena alexandri]
MSTPAPSPSAPILRLPTEILALIFVDVVDPSNAQWLDIITARRNLIYVCARFRAVAESTPILWSRIYVAPAFIPYFISEAIKKTANADLFVDINPHGFRTIDDGGVRRTLKFLPFPEFLAHSVSLLRAEFYRVRSLQVCDGYRSQLFAVMEMVSSFQAQRLSSLRLSASDTYSSGAPPLPAGIRPMRLSVRRVEPLWDTPELYSQVTTISLARLSWLRWSDLQPILHFNSALRELRLSNVQCSTPLEPESVILPNVTAFKLRYETKADRRFVGFIKMPSLQSFELVVGGSGTLEGVALEMPNVLRTAAEVLVEVAQYTTNDLTALVALCTAAQISDSLTSERAAVLLAPPFGGNLLVNEWVLRDWVCRQWKMVNGEITAKVIEGDSELVQMRQKAFIGTGNTSRTVAVFFRDPDHPNNTSTYVTKFTSALAELDLTEPPLSDYNHAAICTLEGRPYDEHWAEVLSTLDIISLFKLSIRSAQLFKVVMAHVRSCQPSSNCSIQNCGSGPHDRLSSLPVELFAIILPELTFGDRLAFSKTSRKLHALCARELQVCVKDLLAGFKLVYAEIRFMQSATHAVLCGQSIAHLIDPSFFPPHIDFVAPNVTYKSVVRFLELATGKEPRAPIFNNLYTPEGHDESVKFCFPDQAQFMRVARSITNSALDCVTYSPFSHLIGAITHYGVWLAYAQTSIRGLTMPNRECIDFSDPATDDRIRSSFALLRSHFKVDFELAWAHDCGRTWECPVTPRTTVDDGCLSMFFPNHPMGHSNTPSHVYPSESSMSWSLSGRCCSLGMAQALSSADIALWQMRLRFDGYERWKRQGHLSDGAIRPFNGQIRILPFSLMPPFPLRERLEFDGTHSMHHFLANVVHGVDFVATRDRSSPGGSRWSFKRCEQDDVALPHVSYRLPVRLLFANVFGQLDYKRNMVDGGVLIRLRCPTNVSCRVQNAYDAQLEQLKQILVANAYFEDLNTIASSWLSLKAGSKVYKPKDGCFYVLVPAGLWDHVVVDADTILELDVSFSLCQREGSSMTTQSRFRLSQVLLKVFFVDYVSENFPISFYLFSQHFRSSVDMASAYLQRYIQAGPKSLAYVEYPDHLLATRDRAASYGSRFTFKDVRMTDLMPFEEPGVVWPTSTTRGTQRTFQCHLFGEILEVVQLKKEKSVAVELRCPVDATCAAESLFRAQLGALHSLIQKDCEDAAGVCTSSWFGLDAHSPGDFAPAETFWLYCVPGRAKKYTDLVDSLTAGALIDADVGFQRFEDDANATLNYYMAATRVAFLDDRMVTRRREGYTRTSHQPRQRAGSPPPAITQPTLVGCLLGLGYAATRDKERGKSNDYRPVISDQRASNMARTKQVYVKSNRIPPPGGWPAHVKVLPPRRPRARPLHTMQARRVDPTADVDSESDSENDEAETDDAEDDGDVESQDAGEEDSTEESRDTDEKDSVDESQDEDEGDGAEGESDVETESKSQPGGDGIEDVDDGGAGGEVMDDGDSSLRSLSSDDDQLYVESLPNASSLPPLFCASLAGCSDFSQTFAERFPGVHLIQAEELALVCGVNVDSLAPVSSLPPIFRELGRPFSGHNSTLRLYNASEAAFLCGSSLEAHSSSFRQAVAASDEQRRRVDATRALNATRRQIAIASSTQRRSSRFQATDGHLTSSQLETISTTEPVNAPSATPSVVKPSSPLLSIESTLPSVARAASPAMDIDTESFALPTTDHYDEIRDPEPPSVDVEPAPQVFIALWPHAMPLEDGILSVFVLPYNVLPPLMIHTKAAPHMSWECVAYVQCRVILLRLQTALREAQQFFAADAHFVAPIRATAETFWDPRQPLVQSHFGLVPGPKCPFTWIGSSRAPSCGHSQKSIH